MGKLRGEPGFTKKALGCEWRPRQVRAEDLAKAAFANLLTEDELAEPTPYEPGR